MSGLECNDHALLVHIDALEDHCCYVEYQELFDPHADTSGKNDQDLTNLTAWYLLPSNLSTVSADAL